MSRLFPKKYFTWREPKLASRARAEVALGELGWRAKLILPLFPSGLAIFGSYLDCFPAIPMWPCAIIFWPLFFYALFFLGLWWTRREAVTVAFLESSLRLGDHATEFNKFTAF